MPEHVISGPLAVFDLDRTLHAGSGLGVLARHAFRDRLIGPERMVRSLAHDLVFRRRGSTDDHINSIAELALEMGAGVSVADLNPVLGRAADQIASSVRPAMMALLDYHRNAGHHCVLLSASPHELVEHIAELLDFHLGIGTIIDVEDGVCTGTFTKPMCYGHGKLARLDELLGWKGRAGTPDVYSYAYADSVSDLPLLEAVHAPFAVWPDRGLRQVARQRDWPVLEA